jgi:membrane protease YdiL (CAAX protease family)
MQTLSEILAVAGPVAIVVAWVVVRAGMATVWTAMGATLALLGILSFPTVDAAGPELSVPVAALIGVGGGVVLYLATAVFLFVALRWPPLARHTDEVYDQRQGLSLGRALAISLLAVAPGEELLWRGVVLGVLMRALPGWPGATVVAWLAYVAANAFSGSLPIVLAAAVGGAAWTALAAWTGGVVAAVACHITWTGLMIVRPPVPSSRRG